MSDYISRQAALDACFDGWNNSADDCARNIKSLLAADVVPYSIEPDGTLTVTVPQGIKVGRVLVQEDGTHCGGLYYAD